jgi:HK97 family phage prohead protease
MMTDTLAPEREALTSALDDLGAYRLGESRHVAQARMSGVSIRESGGGAAWRIFDGHATVFNQRTLLFSIPWSDGTTTNVYETIDPRALDKVLASNPDVHFVDQHDQRLRMARTGLKGMGQLELSADSIGLRTYAQINPKLSYVADLEIAIDDGLVDQMSFAFTIAKDVRDSHTDADGNEDVFYTILEVGELYDVSTVSQGAYPTTDAGLRYRSRIVASMGRAGVNPAGLAAIRTAQADPAGAALVPASDDPAGGDTERAKRLAASARIALALYPER